VTPVPVFVDPLVTGDPSRVKQTRSITAVLPDATAPVAINVKGPERVWPADGVVKETVGAIFWTLNDLETLAL
jgi:hypothetical protein